MCGIVGYVGTRQAQGVLLDGLRRLEYRGYDSAGIATLHGSEIRVAKSKGKVIQLHELVTRMPHEGSVGIAHTRWATHGEPTDVNAHPHQDCSGGIALVHNGIIENYSALKSKLEARGHVFRSQTDTEVLAHLIEDYAARLPMQEAFARALKDVVGTFGIAMVHAAEPRVIYGARRGSPLVIGLGTSGTEFLIASDPAPLLSYTREVIYLDDDEMVRLSDDGVKTTSLDHVPMTKTVESIDWSLEEIERGKHAHFMLKEMHEQPDVVINATRGRLDVDNGTAILGGLVDVDEKLRKIKRLTVVACGSAYLAGTVGEMMIEEYAGIPVDVMLASEFRYRTPLLDSETEAVIAVSQSGETADTLSALREAKRKGVLTLGVVNAVGSSVARETDAGVFCHAGPEIAVASTKGVLAQMTVFALLAMYLGRQRGMSQATGRAIAEELADIPRKIASVLAGQDRIRSLAQKYSRYQNAMYLGRKYNMPLAHEGALKLKEISYLHAEGYAAGEMKHGPIALLDETFPIVAIATQDSVYEKVLLAIEESRARHAPVLAIATEGDERILQHTEDVMYVPKTMEMLSPLVNVIPLQLFAYYVAVTRGLDPDRPRNLAKSVTVE